VSSRVRTDMPLQQVGFVDLPPHVGDGGFDHAAVHEPTGRVYVAHTANDAVEVIDIETRKLVESIGGLPAVAGALVAEPDRVFTSNRGEDTVGVFRAVPAPRVEKIATGMRPNGLAYDGRRDRLLAAHVGDPAVPGSRTVSVIDVGARKRVADVAVAGRTRWTVYDPVADVFHVNIADPPQIVVVAAGDPVGVRRVVPVPHAGPHGLDIDVDRRRLFCACDAGVLLAVDADRGEVLAIERIAGVPDVVFFNRALGRVYVAIGEPGVIEVFDSAPLRRRETVATEVGAHTLSFDATRNVICAFLPRSHRAAVYEDRV
jgi:DNA-binding beta-propeller fold protein YncE